MLDQLLSVSGTLEEELDDGGEELQLDLGVLVVEALEEALQQLVRVVDALGILADNPDHGSSRLGLIQCVQVLAQSRDYALVLVGVLAEDVLDYNYGFLDDVVDLLLG